MSLGTGFEYLMRSVARGDGAAGASSPLTRYYAENGTPPGRWMGNGLDGLAGGAGVVAGGEVSEAQLFNLLGMLADPVTGEPLGRRPAHWPTPLAERIRLRTATLLASFTDAERADAIGRIEAEETDREKHLARPVAGFDLTFSVPKSVSTVWAVADAATQAAIYQAHQDAIATALAWAETNVLFTRSGAGGLVQEDILGVIAAAFDHWDSRAGDPHLHTHVVIANRAQSVSDGVWRSLDSKTLFRYVVALSELHEGVLEDLLTERLGYGWDERARRHSLVPRHDVAGVTDVVIEQFSQRSTQIEAAKALLVAQFAQTHGRQPTTDEVLRLRQHATLETRPDKQHRSLAEQTAAWRERARPFVGGDTVAWADSLRDRCVLPPLRADTLAPAMLGEAARVALDAVAAKRATFTHANVLAEAHRQLHGIRFATPADRLAVADRMTAAALQQALLLTPADLTALPEHLRRADGSSKLQHRGAELYTTQQVLDAETRLLDAGRDLAGPAVHPSVVDDLTARDLPGKKHGLAADQAAAVKAIAGSGRVLDVLVGPAGTGKTASLAGLRATWERVHGPGSVIGLAPSAAAAEVLADELGIDAENTAKWLHEAGRHPRRRTRIDALEHRLHTTTSSPSTVLARQLLAQIASLESECERWSIRPGQLVIIDEASLAGTLTLDQITTQASAAGGKIVLVGDPLQLSAIEAGGAFAMLVNDRDDPPELTEVRRFTHPWERAASLQLRAGAPSAIQTYASHDRIKSGDRDTMIDAVYTAWRDDVSRGRTSLMIAGDRDSVTELNLRARTDRVLAGEVQPAGVEIAGGGIAGVGDHVVTRENNRRLTTGHGWVKNGDTWTVEAVCADGSLRVRREHGKGVVVLPRGYVEHNVELGYASTAFRAQGRSVDTSHALIDTTTTREVLYVGATRGRDSNTVYINTSARQDDDHHEVEGTTLDASDVVVRILANIGAEASAHAVLERHDRSEEPLPEPDASITASVGTSTAPSVHRPSVEM